MTTYTAPPPAVRTHASAFCRCGRAKPRRIRIKPSARPHSLSDLLVVRPELLGVGVGGLLSQLVIASA